MTVPSVDDFKTKLPQLADEDDANIAASLELASMFVDPLVWTEKDYATGVIYLAAHYLLQQKALSSTSGSGGSSSGAETYVSSVSFSDRKVSYGLVKSSSSGGSSGALSDADLSKTMYGQVYMRLRQRNVPMSVVLTGGI